MMTDGTTLYQRASMIALQVIIATTYDDHAGQ